MSSDTWYRRDKCQADLHAGDSGLILCENNVIKHDQRSGTNLISASETT